ncbi:5546_t:CDS:2 [Paraglomus brasilianum]|uniref:5546_t:CDS:1 n=1 Tax=Paraglomus brasilianum TaxID=144538 RepID=A0A9N9CAZ3_9GLOM|nr:5546_t:CDS:2 [Paraglomus brasilianum]
MEKFSRWRDSSTGIQPFSTPLPSRRRTDSMEHLLFLLGEVLKPLLGIVKSVLVLLALLLLFLIRDMIGVLLLPLGAVHRAFRSIFTALLTRLALLFMGFYWITVENVTLKRGRSHAKGHKKNISNRIKSGDVIVSNWCSYIDVLYFAFKFNPVFTQLYPATNTLRPISLWRAIAIAGSYPEFKPPTNLETYKLKDLCQLAAKNRWGPIVIFPEATTSNGRALLKFCPIFHEMSLPVKNCVIHVYAIKYDYEGFSPTYTVGSRFWHFMRLCGEFKNTLTVKHLATEESPSSPSFTASLQSTSTPFAKQDMVGSQVIHLLHQISRLRMTNLGVLDKADFLNYYWRTNSAYGKNRRIY